jgi:transcriptional regulator with XRE-family HTH domain
VVAGCATTPCPWPAHRRTRRGAGLTQAQLAVHADLAIGTLTRLEGGSTDPSWSSVRAIAEALGVSLTVLGRLVEGNEPTTGSSRARC